MSLSCPDPFPSAPTPALKKKKIIPFKTRKKTKIKNCSKSPQSRERTRLGNCSLLLPHREEGRELRGNSAVDCHTQKRSLCVFGGHHPASSDTALNHHSHTPKPWGRQGSNHTSTKTAMVLLCGCDTVGVQRAETPLVAGMGISLWSH